MRPRYNILLYCRDENRLGVLRFVMNNMRLGGSGFLVWGATSKCDVARLMTESDQPNEFYRAAVVIHSHPIDAAVGIAHDLMIVHDIPTIFLTEGSGMEKAWMAVSATVSLPKSVTVAEWTERLRVICARKRGPKKENQTRLEQAQVVIRNHTIRTEMRA